VEADMPGKFSFACWKRGPKLKEADWTQIGLVNGAVRYLDNKLCLSCSQRVLPMNSRTLSCIACYESQ
jgi:hypothetical protein